MSILKVLGKISEWIPSRDEYRRNKIEKLQRKMDELQEKDYTARNLVLYSKYSEQLQKLRKKLKNS